MDLAQFAQRRLLIVTGKGGVGKTSVAAGLAQALSQSGRRVLLADTSRSEGQSPPVHALYPSVSISGDPVLVRPNVWAVALSAATGHRRFLEDVLPVRVLADAAMRSNAVRSFLVAAPGFAEMGMMYHAMDLLGQDSKRGKTLYDVCIIDSPATGHALALAQIPAFLLNVIPAGPMARVARDGLALLSDPSQTSALIVTAPEVLPLTEALELSAGLRRHKIDVGAIAINKVPAPPTLSPGARSELETFALRESLLGYRQLKRAIRTQGLVDDFRTRWNGELWSFPEVVAPPAGIVDIITESLLRDGKGAVP